MQNHSVSAWVYHYAYYLYQDYHFCNFLIIFDFMDKDNENLIEINYN